MLIVVVLQGVKKRYFIKSSENRKILGTDEFSRPYLYLVSLFNKSIF